MKHVFRFLFVLCVLWLLSPCAFAAEQIEDRAEVDLPWTDDLYSRMEKYWKRRIPDSGCSFRFVLTDCGEQKLDYRTQGILDVSYRFSHTDWTEYRTGRCASLVSENCRLGDNAVLRVRCFAYCSGGAERFCVMYEIISEHGRHLSLSADNKNVPPTFTFSFESFPAVKALDEAPPETVPGQSVPPNRAAPAREPDLSDVRRWTYCSSDERVLWSVELRGVFAGAQCLEAGGEVWVYDESWRCVETRYYVRDGCAVAAVTFQRSTLGIPVAERSYEFRIPSPARASPAA